jgi:hypothetical protein
MNLERKMNMKVKPLIGMNVCGEVALGTIVAMSKEWCIYEAANGFGKIVECAEPWEDIIVLVDKPTCVTNSVTEGPEVRSERS